MARPFPSLSHPHAGINLYRGSKPEEELVTASLHAKLDFCRDRDWHGDRGSGFVPSDPADGPDAHARAGPDSGVGGYFDRRDPDSCYLSIPCRCNDALRCGSACSQPMVERDLTRLLIPVRAILISLTY